MSSKIEYEYGWKDSGQGIKINSVTMTTTKPNGDELMVKFGCKYGCSFEGETWNYPNVEISHRQKKTEVEPPKKFLGIALGKSKTKEVYEDTPLYDEALSCSDKKAKYLDEFLREFAKSRDDSKMLERVDSKFRPIVSRAMYAMLAGGLSDALLKVDNAAKEAEQKKAERMRVKQMQKQVKVDIANSFFDR